MRYKTQASNAPVAQSVEQEAFNFEVGGSSPPGRTKTPFGEQCIALRKQDKSIEEIVRITGRPKTSVYYYIKDISLSDARLQRYRTASGKHIRRYALARKGRSVRPFRPFARWTPEAVQLLGHLLFDGELTRGAIYNNRSKTLVNRVELLMHVVYEFEPKRWQNPRTGVHRISYHNVALGAYFDKKARELLSVIHRLPHEYKRAFLQAFFDDEGCMDFRPQEGRRKVRGYQKEIRILRVVHNLLHDFNIESAIVLPNEVSITGRVNLQRFETEIGFSRGVCVNGNRTNSRWKKHIEKRKLLKMAIESYKNQ